jgi:hypothetical protein
MINDHDGNRSPRKIYSSLLQQDDGKNVSFTLEAAGYDQENVGSSGHYLHTTQVMWRN